MDEIGQLLKRRVAICTIILVQVFSLVELLQVGSSGPSAPILVCRMLYLMLYLGYPSTVE